MSTAPVVSVEITECRAPATTAERQRRADAAARLTDLNLIPADSGEVGTDTVTGYKIRINGVDLPVPVDGYEVVATETGPAVTITIGADTVTIGTPKPPKDTARVWGAPSRDPREGVPGWAPSTVGSSSRAVVTGE